ncbi:MAG TPA: SelB C-terminal domain-containing protein, partial [Methylomirabilota bacterium]|nr:SelB C-terminal domain-containing protein [Methylomirabilota bacterium]
GLDRLRQEIVAQLSSYERPPLPGYFRLPIDRAFVMRGHGVVVTGTAVAGTVREGDTVRILPGGEETRVRSIQVHGQPVTAAHWGQRVAMNLAGLEKRDLTRGHVVSHPKLTLTTRRFDAFVEIRPGAKRDVENHERVRVHIGTAEVLGKIIMLDGREALAPRSTAFCQIALEEPVVALRGDRFILRNQTAQGTLGGGEVLHPFAQRHRRTETGVVERLAALRTTDLLQACRAYLEAQSEFAAPLEEIYQGVNAREEEVAALLAQDQEILPLPDQHHPEAYSVLAKWRKLTEEVQGLLAAFHHGSPLARGMEMESLRTQLSFSFSPKIFRAVTDKLVAEQVAVREESALRLPSHKVTLSEDEQGAAGRVERLLLESDLTPPELKELESKVSVPRKALTDLLNVLESQGKVVKVATELYFASPALEKARTALLTHLTTHEDISAAGFRDLLGISRKTAIPLLEYFDRTGLTLRVGDVRKLRKK